MLFVLELSIIFSISLYYTSLSKSKIKKIENKTKKKSKEKIEKKIKKRKNKTKSIIHNFDNRYPIYSYYTFQSSKLAYFMKNDKNNITRDISNRNI